MKIVVLDGGTLRKPLSAWEPVSALGEFVFYEDTPRVDDVIVQRIADADIVLTNKVPLTAPILRAVPSVKLISTLATGYNQVDVACAAEQGIVVCNVPAYSTETVAQHVMAFILHFTNRVAEHADWVRSGAWAESPYFSFWNAEIRELHTLTIGIIGAGAIGQRVAQLAAVFGAKVLMHSRAPKNITGVEWVALDDLLARSDFVSLHCPLTPQTHHLMNAQRFAQMKPGACLINTSRGDVVASQDLADALTMGHLGAAAVDVVSQEPMPADHPFSGVKNLIVTPHMAWAGEASLNRLLQITEQNIRAFLLGSPLHQVN